MQTLGLTVYNDSIRSGRGQVPSVQFPIALQDAFDSAKNRKRKPVTAKREKSQTPKFETAE